MFSKGKLLLIPDSADIVLHGSPRDARCAVISGRIVFTSKVPRTVNSLVVRFKPKQDDLLNPSISISSLSEIICTVVKDGQTEPTSDEASFNATTGEQEWHFSMGVPGNISETVFSPPAFIAYELCAELRTASVMRWTPFCRLTCTVPMAVKRIPEADSAWAALASEQFTIASKWRERVELTTMAGSRTVHDARAFHISGNVRPLIKGMRLLRAGFEIREFIEGPFDCNNDGMPSRGTTVARCSRELNVASLEKSQDGLSVQMGYFPSTTLHRVGVAIDQDICISGSLNIPCAYESIQYDIASGPIKVSHEIVFAVSVVDVSGQVHNIRLSSGIYVFPPVSSEVVDLPRYENCNKDILLAVGQRRSLRMALASHPDTRTQRLVESWGAENAGVHEEECPPPEYSPDMVFSDHRRSPPHVHVRGSV
ncbi:hypothetical protein LPJ66_006622 [Kickxella alabastrina]|uniref:Uncharacterized protein n=1 Tax=Kickxella alabastrina TaxID=61397 RepID=A0ACC1IBE2_9FUNG|nr:hypothetical protein LPJ66_006622 [Kickxella alabastrina]